MPTLDTPTGVRAPGWRSDLGLHGALGSLDEVAEGWRCELPSVPENPFGTVLVLRGSPEAYTPEAVAAGFEKHFAGTAAPQLCVGWDDPGAEAPTLAPFLARGFETMDDVALAFTGAEIDGGPADSALRLRRLDLNRDLSRVLACELAVDAQRGAPYGAEALRRGLTWSRELVALGEIGGWYGAELDGQIVATLGIVSVGGEGRLQSVGTRPNHRNRGIGGALLAWAWGDARARLGVERLLLITARGGDAERFYRRLGFQRVGSNLGVMRAR